MFKDLYLINTKALARKLANNEISEEVALWHFMVQAVLLGGFMILPVGVACGDQDESSLYMALFGMLVSGGACMLGAVLVV